MTPVLSALIAICGAPFSGFGAESSAEALDHFENEIRPLLVERCMKCHGGKKTEAGLRLESISTILVGGDSGPAVVPGQPDASLLVKAVRHEDGLEMPPNGQLDKREIAALERWIKDGAVWPEGMTLGGGGPKLRGGPITDEERAFWSFQPTVDHAPPEVDFGEAIHNDIDRFILARLIHAGLEPRAPADKRTLIRRATFDLTGLPPTPEDIQSFLADNSPGAFERVIDRLLETRAYGERWGRHWLDVVRYADTAGETGDYPTPLSYKYRNWVIDSFNDDKPYDDFVRDQIAGDLLAKRMIESLNGSPSNDEILARYREMMTATGFIAISRRFGFDVENYHHLTIQDTIDTLGQSVLGLSLGCARCHDHKYDPVNTDDYYAWYGIFESTKYSFPGSEEKKRPRDSFPVLPTEVASRRKAEYDARLAAIDKELKRLNGLRESAEMKLKAGDGDSAFAGFETQPLGTGMLEPWGTLEDLRVVGDAQSPYDNVFAAGDRGLAMPSNAGNNAFGRELAMAYTPVTTPTLYYNIDFRLTELADNGGGAFRFYMGRGPGNSAAVEMSASATAFFVKNGSGYEPVHELKIGEWYNLQVTADLRNRTYFGTIGKPGEQSEFSDKAFTDGWDGTIDRTFVDKYGARGGVIPARHFDNLNVSTTPFLPVGKSIREHSAERPSTRWQSYIEARRLTHADKDRDGHAGFDVWHGDPLPIVGINTSDRTVEVPGTIPPKAFVVHPNPKKGVGVAWRSPVTGRIRVTGRVQDAHDCGDSITWHLDHLTVGGLATIDEGAIDKNSAHNFATVEKPLVIDVQRGEFLQLAIMPKAHYGCDLTQVDLTIEEVNGEKRSWNLAADVVDDLLAGNPGSDQYGDAPWFFYTVAEDRGRSFDATPVVELAASEAAKLRSALDDFGHRIASLTAEQTELMKAGPYEVIYGAVDQDEPKDAQIRIRGARYDLGDVVPRKNLDILGNDPLPEDAGSGRLELAEWLLRESNPLPARVMVNRIWQHHFGRGIVATENDFGTRGEPPSHPKLLDWLASRFRESGWSVKAMHRLIMTSAAYQRSSDFDEAVADQDPDARLLWRFNRRRLSAEEIRDAMLFVSGDLDSTVGGAHPFPASDTWGFSQHAPYYGVYPTNQRSVYLMQQRLKRHPFLSLFDGADPNVPTARRELTTVPTQALYLMNNEFVHKRSCGMAERLIAEADDERTRIDRAFRLTLGRPASETEIDDSLEFLVAYRNALADDDAAEVTAWAGLARTMLTRNEFLFVD